MFMVWNFQYLLHTPFLIFPWIISTSDPCQGQSVFPKFEPHHCDNRWDLLSLDLGWIFNEIFWQLLPLFQDMEKWAKMLNAQKEGVKKVPMTMMASAPTGYRLESATADCGFALFEQKVRWQQ